MFFMIFKMSLTCILRFFRRNNFSYKLFYFHKIVVDPLITHAASVSLFIFSIPENWYVFVMFGWFNSVQGQCQHLGA